MPMLLPGSVLGLGYAEVTQDEFLPWTCPSSGGRDRYPEQCELYWVGPGWWGYSEEVAWGRAAGE